MLTVYIEMIEEKVSPGRCPGSKAGFQRCEPISQGTCLNYSILYALRSFLLRGMMITFRRIKNVVASLEFLCMSVLSQKVTESIGRPCISVLTFRTLTTIHLVSLKLPLMVPSRLALVSRSTPQLVSSTTSPNWLFAKMK